MTPQLENDEEVCNITPEDLADEPYIEAERCSMCHKQTDELFRFKDGLVCTRCLPKLLQSTIQDYIQKVMETHTQITIPSDTLSQNILQKLKLDVDTVEFGDITTKYVKLQQIAKDLPYMIHKKRGNIHISV